jgi:hypothetical protein
MSSPEPARADTKIAPDSGFSIDDIPDTDRILKGTPRQSHESRCIDPVGSAPLLGRFQMCFASSIDALIEALVAGNMDDPVPPTLIAVDPGKPVAPEAHERRPVRFDADLDEPCVTRLAARN